MSQQGCHATGTGTLSFTPRSILVNFILAYKNELPLQNHATSLRGMIHSSGMAHRCKSPLCDPPLRLASVQMLSHRHASGLTLVPYLEPSISQVAHPQWSVTAPLVTGPRARAGSSKALRQDKGEPGSHRVPAVGQGTRGPRSIGLLMNNELCAGGGGRRLGCLACCRWAWGASRRGAGWIWSAVIPLDALLHSVAADPQCPMAFRIMPGS